MKVNHSPSSSPVPTSPGPLTPPSPTVPSAPPSPTPSVPSPGRPLAPLVFSLPSQTSHVPSMPHASPTLNPISVSAMTRVAPTTPSGSSQCPDYHSNSFGFGQSVLSSAVPAPLTAIELPIPGGSDELFETLFSDGEFEDLVLSYGYIPLGDSNNSSCGSFEPYDLGFQLGCHPVQVFTFLCSYHFLSLIFSFFLSFFFPLQK
jgi:hypothetical protein